MKPILSSFLLAICMIGTASAQTAAIAKPPGTDAPVPATDVATIGVASDGSLSFAEALDVLTANNHMLKAARRNAAKRSRRRRAGFGGRGSTLPPLSRRSMSPLCWTSIRYAT